MHLIQRSLLWEIAVLHKKCWLTKGLLTKAFREPTIECMEKLESSSEIEIWLPIGNVQSTEAPYAWYWFHPSIERQCYTIVGSCAIFSLNSSTVIFSHSFCNHLHLHKSSDALSGLALSYCTLQDCHDVRNRVRARTPGSGCVRAWIVIVGSWLPTWIWVRVYVGLSVKILDADLRLATSRLYKSGVTQPRTCHVHPCHYIIPLLRHRPPGLHIFVL